MKCAVLYSKVCQNGIFYIIYSMCEVTSLLTAPSAARQPCQGVFPLFFKSQDLKNFNQGLRIWMILARLYAALMSSYVYTSRYMQVNCLGQMQQACEPGSDPRSHVDHHRIGDRGLLHYGIASPGAACNPRVTAPEDDSTG